eukprot:742414-Prorocentrum_minimum.AAC.3
MVRWKGSTTGNPMKGSPSAVFHWRILNFEFRKFDQRVTDCDRRVTDIHTDSQRVRQSPVVN